MVLLRLMELSLVLKVVRESPRRAGRKAGWGAGLYRACLPLFTAQWKSENRWILREKRVRTVWYILQLTVMKNSPRRLWSAGECVTLDSSSFKSDSISGGDPGGREDEDLAVDLTVDGVWSETRRRHFYARRAKLQRASHLDSYRKHCSNFRSSVCPLILECATFLFP